MLNQRKMGTILQYVQMALSMVISLAYTPVMLRILGQSEYGIYSLASSIISYLSILSFGFAASYIRFYSRYKAKNDSDGIASLNGMFLSVFAVIAVIAAVAGLYLSMNVGNFFTADKGYSPQDIDTARILMLFLTLNLALSFPTSLFMSYVTSQEKFVFQKLINIGKTVVAPVLTLPLLLLGYGSIGMVFITTVVTVTVDLMNVFYCFKKLKMKISFKNMKPLLLKEIAGFSVFIAINQIIDQVNWNVAKVVLAKIVNAEAVAIYSVAAHVHVLYNHFSTAVSNVFVPAIHKIIAEKKADMNERLTQIFVKTGRIQYALMMLILTGFIFFGQYFIYIWAGEEYSLSYAITLLLIAPTTIALIQNIGIEIQRGKNKHRFRSYVYLAMAVLNVIISIVMCTKVGTIGAAIGTATSLVVANGVIMNIYYHKALGIDIINFWAEILKMSKGLIIPVALGILIDIYLPISSIPMFLGLIAVYMIVYIGSMWLFGMNEYERDLLNKPLKKLLKRK